MHKLELKDLDYESYEDAPTIQKRVVDFTLAGMTPETISSHLALNQKDVFDVQSHPAMKEYMRRHEETTALALANATSRFDRLLDLATKRLEEILNDDDTPKSIRLKAAETIFDRHRSGQFSKQTKHESTQTHRTIDATRIAEIRREGEALGKTSSEVLDCIQSDNGSGGSVFQPQGGSGGEDSLGDQRDLSSGDVD